VSDAAGEQPLLCQADGQQWLDFSPDAQGHGDSPNAAVLDEVFSDWLDG
jgi:hypothetical protein